MFSAKNIPGSLPIFRSISNMVVRVTVLVVFLIVASALLYIYPISSSLHLNMPEKDRYETSFSAFVSDNHSSSQSLQVVPVDDGEEDMVIQKPLSTENVPRSSEEDSGLGSKTLTHINSIDNFGSPNTTNVVELPEWSSLISNQNGKPENSGTDNSEKVASSFWDTYTYQGHQAKNQTSQRNCDLYHGKWIHDPAGPLYTNNSCPVITQMQNCQGNGRPDKDYENWRWKPERCDLPRFDAKKLLELMRGKTLAFVGDSVARNQMESLLCILWQVEVPKNRGNRRMQRMFFRSTSTTIIRIWSSWLVHQTTKHFQSVPDNVVKVHLDLPDENFMEFLPNFDIVVVSSGHWFAKQSAYILNGKIVGGQLWQPKRLKKMKINNVEAFRISVETCLTAIASHPNFTGLAIVRSYSPDHYEGGAWNTGGSCTGKVSPAAELVRNEFKNLMHEKQVRGFERAFRKGRDGSKLILMDITDPFEYRSDGHPGPYRNTDPSKITKRGPDGQPPPQDCLHWCMPGPIDTWNEILLEIIRRDFEKE